MWVFRAFGSSLAAVAAWVGILNLPRDIHELPQSLTSWGPLMLFREHVLIGFTGILVLWVFWTDIRPFVKNHRIVRALSGLKNDPSDILLAKKELADFTTDHLHPCHNSVYEAVRVASYIYKPKTPDEDIQDLITLGIQSRLPRRQDMAILVDKEKIRTYTVEVLENTMVPAISTYLAAANTLNMVCKHIIRDGGYIDRKNYPQKDGESFFNLVQTWSRDHAAFEVALHKLIQGSSFIALKYSVQKHKLLDNNFDGKAITEFLEKHEILLIPGR
jgi:hypothetical protein